MILVTEEKVSRIKYTNISITRGDCANLVLPIYEDTNGTRTPYIIDPGDTFAIQVREAPVTKANPVPALIFQGTTAVLSGELNWSITATDSTQDCGKYYWDAQITTTNGKIYTFYQGWFIVLPEATIPPTP